MPRPVLKGGRFLVVALALVGFMAVGHFWATDLAVEDRPLMPVPDPVATWGELQDYFDECLAEPVPLTQWRGVDEAGVVVVLRAAGALETYALVRCFETDDMAGGEGSDVEAILRELQGASGQERRLLVAWCGTGVLDEASRQRFRQEFQDRFGLVGPE